MKNLFHTGSLIEINGVSSMRINGPYTLLALNSDQASIQTNHYTIEVIAEDLTVDTLSEEVAVLTFSSMIKMIVDLVSNKEENYDS